MKRVLVCTAAIAWCACSGPEEPAGTTPERSEEAGAEPDESVETSVEQGEGTSDEPAPEPLEVVEHDGACRPHDARAEGECDAILGTFWQGNRCVQISGCRCVGDDCEDALGSIGECEELYEHCR